MSHMTFKDSQEASQPAEYNLQDYGLLCPDVEK